jgi:hypothetical protein
MSSIKPPDTLRVERMQRFVDNVPRMLAACAYIHEELYEHCSLHRALELAVEVADESDRESVAHCLGHYAYWGRTDLGGDRRRLREALRRHFESPILEIYDTFSRSDFGAWRYQPMAAGALPTIEALDGQRREETQIVHATTTGSKPLCHEAVVAGWLVEIEHMPMLLLACELDEVASQKLSRACERQAWGEAGAFRTYDYHADVLALMLEPMCIDATRVLAGGALSGGRRVFLSPLVDGWGWGRSSIKLGITVQDRLAAEGLRHRGERLPWHLAVSRAQTAADIEDIFDQLAQMRCEAVAARIEPRHPLGPHTFEALLSSRELLEMIGLTSEGVLEEHDGYLDLSLRHLGVDSEELVACGVGVDCSLEEVLRDTAQLSPAALEALGEAIDLARTRVRWTTILRGWLDPSSPWTREPTLHELVVVVRHLFRAEMWRLPVRDLPDPGHGTWRRLQKGCRAVGFKGRRLRVCDVAALADRLDNLPGVGATTLEHAARALATTLADWPAGPPWRSTTAAAAPMA